MKIRSTLFALFAGALVAASAPPAARAAEKPITLALSLPSKPAYPRPEVAALLTEGPVALDVTDARKGGDLAIVGAQREKGQDVYVWRARQPVAPAVKEFAAQILNAWSVRVSPEADSGLKLSLTKYDVNERSDKFGSTYIAEVGFQVAFVGRDGKAVWTGEATGKAKQPGIDARASECNDVLSLALRDALAKVVTEVSPESAASAAPAPAAAPAPIAIEPEALFADLTRLKAGGVADDVLVAYVEQRRISRPLNVDEILRWKGAGLPDAAIKAATRP